MSQPTIKSKQRIFEEAAKLFQEKGYLSANMRELAGRVDLKVSSLYSHIGSKEELLHKICFEGARAYLMGMKETEASQATPSEKIRALISLHIRLAMEDVTTMTIFGDEWRHLSEPYLTEFLDLRRDYEQRFVRLLQQGIECGELVPMNPTIALFTILNSLRWLHRWYPEKRGIPLADIEAEIIRLVFHGICRA